MINKKLLVSQKTGFIAITGCVLFWGFSFISTKIALAVFPPMSLGLLRFSIAIIFLYIIKRKLSPLEKLHLKDIPGLFAAGFTGVTLYFFFENNGISLVSASEASIAAGSIPALIMITEWLLGRLRVRRQKKTAHNGSTDNETELQTVKARQWIGCFVSIAGVWLVAGASFALSGSIKGYIYMCGAAFSWAAYTFITRSLFKGHSVIFIVFWQSLAGLICFIPFSAVEFKNWGIPAAAVIFHIIFLAVFCSAAGHWFYVLAMETLSVCVSGVFLNMIPVVTVVAGFFVLGERLNPVQWFGSALVICGVTLAMIW